MRRVVVVGAAGSGKTTMARALSALPRWRVMSQLLVRTVSRGLSREELWAGNRERLGNLIRRDPERNILVWSWTTHAKLRHRYRAVAVDPRWSALTFVRARSRREAGALLATVA